MQSLDSTFDSFNGRLDNSRNRLQRGIDAMRRPMRLVCFLNSISGLGLRRQYQTANQLLSSSLLQVTRRTSVPPSLVISGLSADFSLALAAELDPCPSCVSQVFWRKALAFSLIFFLNGI
jgi:hypothetical protein